MKIKQARQGDLLFCEISDIPKSLPLKKDPILAYGEVTGHAHRVVAPNFDNVDMFVDTNGDILMYSATEDIVIDHEEHGKITLPAKKIYRMTRQREYDAAVEDLQRRVAD